MSAHDTPPLHLVLFDVDGTLVETAHAGRDAFVEAFRIVFGRDGVAEAARGVRFQGRTDPAILRAIVRGLDMDPEDLAGGASRFWETYVRLLRELLDRPHPRRRALPGVRALLDDLSAREEVYLGLLTGNIEAGARAKLGALGLDAYFPDGGFGSDDGDRRVVARLAHEKLSRRYGLEFDPARTVVVGDTALDVDCARANGFRAVAVDHGWVPREELVAAGPDALLDGFTDLAAVHAAFDLPPAPPDS